MLEDRFRAALEIIATSECVCEAAGTCPVCLAQEALVPANLSANSDESVSITLDGYEDERPTVLKLGRLDGKFPLVSEDGKNALTEASLHLLSVVVLALKSQIDFDIAAKQLGLVVTIDKS